MVKMRRASDPWRSRLFKTSNQSSLAELHDRGFDRESQMHKLIERNIGTLFPGLKLLETEFREMARGELRPDTIAFDTTLDTFVALEYKNRLNKEAVDQARTYLSSMRQHRAELVLSHSKNMRCSPRDLKSFKWKKMYAIIMAPEFGDYQVFGADEDTTVELYEISMYDDCIMLVERVGGDHERTPATALAPSPGIEAPHTQAAAHTSSHVSDATQMDQLYGAIRTRLLGKFPGAEETTTKYYKGFRHSGGNYFCTVIPQKSKIWLYYSGRRAASELKPDGFVLASPNKKWGSYRSELKNEDDFEKALVVLKELHAVDRSESAQSSSSAQQASGKRIFPDELLDRALLPQHDRRLIRTAIFAVRLSIAEGDRTVLTYGGIDTENRVLIVNQEIVSDPFSEIVETVKGKQRQMESAEFRGTIVVPVDATGVGASLLAVLRDGGISGCVEFRLTDGRMDAAYNNLRTELETGRAFVQEPKYQYKDELYAQLRGIVQDRDGTMRESKGSDCAASLAIAVWGARHADGQNRSLARDNMRNWPFD